MKVYRMIAAALVGTLTLGIAPPASPQNTADRPTPTARETTSTAAPVFTPGFDDLMTMLIQPRHLKLYYAGTRKNWELAAFESQELGAALRRIAQAIPRYQDNGVDETVGAMIVPLLKTVDAAIAAADPKQFVKAYTDLTSGCNACHTYMERPFLVIRVPGGDRKNSAYPDQDFGAKAP